MRKVEVMIVDDLDGESEATETVAFALDGTSYEIDLSAENAGALREAFARYVEPARTVGKAKGSGKGASKPSRIDGPRPADVRKWAKDNGHDVPERGRMPETITQAYREAHAS